MEFIHKDLIDNLNISGIYWMFFPNKKYYFGSSKNIQERIWSHKGECQRQVHANNHFQNIYNKYGFPENIVVAEISNYLEIEQELLDNHFTDKNCINLADKVGQPGDKRITIYEYNLDGNFIQEWSCIYEAANYYNISKGNICTVLNGERRTVSGRRFSRTKYDKLPEYQYSGNRKMLFETRVCQYDKEGKLVAVHDNMHSAGAAIVGVQKHRGNSNIENAIVKPMALAYNFYWRRLSKDNIPETIEIEKRPSRKRKIYQYNLEGELLRTWNNCQEVVQETGMNLNSLYSKLSRPKSENDKCWRYV